MVRQIVEPRRGINMGRLVVDVIVENVEDVRRAQRGEIRPDQVRRQAIQALVDTGATFLCLPEPLIRQLGLPFNRQREARTITGPIVMRIYGGARITVNDRDCDDEVMALPEGRQPLLGQIPLEKMDWWVDLTNQKLVGNPEHDGQWMAEVY